MHTTTVRRALLAGACLTAPLWAAAATAQHMEKQQAEDWAGDMRDVILLSDWNYDPLYTDGWSVEDVLEETTALDESGEAIGDIENLVFTDSGRLVSVVAEVGGFLAMGETTVSIPWAHVKLSDDATSMTLPVTEATMGDYSVFDDVLFGDEPELESTSGDVSVVEGEVETGESAFRATDLIGDYASLSDEERYGYVNDIIVKDGRIAALVIKAAGLERQGDFAYPWAGYESWVNPKTDARFSLPYTREEAEVIENFEYDRLQRRSRD